MQSTKRITMAKRTTKPQRDWTLTADRIQIGTDTSWMRHIRDITGCSQIEAQKEFERAVSSRILRCDSLACQMFMSGHGIPVYYFNSKK